MNRGGAVARLGHAAQGRGAVIIGEVIQFRRGECLYGGRNTLLAGVIHDDDICVTLSAIRSTRAQIEIAVARIAAEVVGGEMRWRSDPILVVYHCTASSVGLTEQVWR